MDSCTHCRRPLTGPDADCPRCGRPALAPATIARATDLVTRFATAHARDPWLRSAGLLSYSLRSRRRGFLDDPTRPFTRAALELLHALAVCGGASGVSPLAETALATVDNPPLTHALLQLLERYRVQLATPGETFEIWMSR